MPRLGFGKLNVPHLIIRLLKGIMLSNIFELNDCKYMKISRIYCKFFYISVFSILVNVINVRRSLIIIDAASRDKIVDGL